MENFLFSLVSGAQGPWAYAIVFGVLLMCGMGVPMPEDISLILGGFLVYEGSARLVPMMATGYLGIICGDSIVFFLGRRLGNNPSKPAFLSKIFTPEKRERVKNLFAKHGEKIVFIARFLPGVRAVTYFTAGSVGMRYSRFMLYDSVAALISAPAFVYLGFRFGGELKYILSLIQKGQRGVLVALVAAIVLYFLVKRWRRASAKS